MYGFEDDDNIDMTYNSLDNNLLEGLINKESNDVIDDSNDMMNNNFSNFGLKKIDDIIGHINSECERLDISNNNLELLDFEKIPDNITSITASNNDIICVNFKHRAFENIYLNCNNILSDVIEDAVINKLFMRKAFDSRIEKLTIKNSIIGKLVLDDNYLTEIVFENTVINNLSISDNMLEIIYSLPQGLERLFLSKNKINHIAIEFEDDIKILDLSGNYIQNIHFNLPKNLEKLYLGSNMISEINTTFPKTLQIADLNNNHIEDVKNLTINDDLIELDLSSNKLKEEIKSPEYGGLSLFNLEDNDYNRQHYSYLGHNICYDNEENYDNEGNDDNESNSSDIQIRAIIENESDSENNKSDDENVYFMPNFENNPFDCVEEDNHHFNCPDSLNKKENKSFNDFQNNPDNEELRKLRSLFYDNREQENNRIRQQTFASDFFNRKYGNFQSFTERMNQINQINQMNSGNFSFDFLNKIEINNDKVPVVLRWKD